MQLYRSKKLVVGFIGEPRAGISHFLLLILRKILKASDRAVQRSKPDKELLTKLLSALSLGEKAVVFPWLPHWKIVELTLQLDLKVYVGDPDLHRCEEIIAKLEFNKLIRH